MRNELIGLVKFLVCNAILMIIALPIIAAVVMLIR